MGALTGRPGAGVYPTADHAVRTRCVSPALPCAAGVARHNGVVVGPTRILKPQRLEIMYGDGFSY